MRRILAGLLVVVGVIVAILGVGSGTWWKPSEEVTAVAEPTSNSGMIVTNPGVLELVNDEVAVVARAEGHNVEMVVARSSVIDEWLNGRPAVRIDGLASWSELSYTETDGDPAPSSIAGSDLFNPENQIEGANAVQLRFEVPEGDWSILAVSDGNVTPAIELTWHRSVSTPWMIPLMILGLLLAATGGAILLHDYQLATLKKKRASANARAERQESADITETTTFRAITDAEQTGDRAADTGGALGAGIVPASSRADELRETELDESARVVLPEPEAIDENESEAGSEDAIEDSSEEHDVMGDEPGSDEDQAELGDEGPSEHETDTDVTPEEGAPEEKDSGSNAWRNLWGFGSKEER